MFWIKFSWNYFELNIELNQFWAKWQWMMNQMSCLQRLFMTVYISLCSKFPDFRRGRRKTGIEGTLKGRACHQNWWIFGKVPNGLWSPPPHFRKIILQFFPKFMTEVSRGEREFPFPVIPGNTSLKFPFPSHGIL